MRRTMTTRRLLVALIASLALIAAACSSGDDTASGGAPEVTDLTVGVLPLVHVAPLYWAIQEGYFADEGLTVTAETAQGGATIIPSIVSGGFQMGYSNYVSIIQADQSGVADLRIAAENDRAADDHGVYALASSGLTGPADLAGKTIAVNTIDNIGTLGIKAVLASEGVDPESITFVEVPFPDMVATLELGNVDAVWVVEPFQALLKANLDAVLVLDLFSGPAEELPIAGWVTTQEFADANPNTVAAYLRAVAKATADIEADPEIIVEIVPTYSRVTAEVAALVGLPRFVSEPDAEELQRVADLMIETGISTEKYDVKAELLN